MDDVLHRKIPRSVAKVVLLMAVSLVFTGLGLWLFLVADDQFRFTPFLARSAGLLAMLLFGGSLILLIVRLWNRGPGLEITPEGIADLTGRSLRVRWEEVVRLGTDEMFGLRFILVYLRDPEGFMKDRDPFQRISMEWNFSRYGTPLTLSSGALACSTDELLRYLEEGLEAYRKREEGEGVWV